MLKLGYPLISRTKRSRSELSVRTLRFVGHPCGRLILSGCLFLCVLSEELHTLIQRTLRLSETLEELALIAFRVENSKIPDQQSVTNLASQLVAC